MSQPRRLSSLAIFAVLALVLTGLVSSPASAGNKATRGKVNYGNTSWVSGASGYSVKGKVSGRKHRLVALQIKWSDGWHTIAKTKTKKKGKYSFTGSLNWYGVHKVRVMAPRTKRDRARKFKGKKFSIAVPWVPRGLPTSYSRFNHNGMYFQWNPCKTINYRVNTGYAGEPAIAITQTSMELLSRATGFKTKYVGTTTAVPLDKKRYPKGTDLVVAWGHQDDYPELIQAVGLGGTGPSKPARRRSNNKLVLQIKQPGVTMNMAYGGLYPMTMDDAGHESMGLVLVHELGHALGLDHFADDIQIMHPGNRSPMETGYHPWYEAGDLAGLRAQGAQGGCLKPYRSKGRWDALDLVNGVHPGMYRE